MAVLVLSDKGLPSCYMTNGMIIAFDPARRGQLLLHEHGHPSLLVGLDESAERAICTVEFKTRATGAFALIDVSSILSGLLAKATHARLEDAGYLIEITTPRSSASVRLAQDDEPYVGSRRRPKRSGAFHAGNGFCVSREGIER